MNKYSPFFKALIQASALHNIQEPCFLWSWLLSLKSDYRDPLNVYHAIILAKNNLLFVLLMSYQRLYDRDISQHTFLFISLKINQVWMIIDFFICDSVVISKRWFNVTNHIYIREVSS